MKLPDCMMPDGADPCLGYRELNEALATCRELREYDRKEIERLRSLSDYAVRDVVRGAEKIKDLRVAEEDLHYLRSILGHLRELRALLTGADYGLGVEVLNDNIDWLYCFIAKHRREHENDNLPLLPR